MKDLSNHFSGYGDKVSGVLEIKLGGLGDQVCGFGNLQLVHTHGGLYVVSMEGSRCHSPPLHCGWYDGQGSGCWTSILHQGLATKRTLSSIQATLLFQAVSCGDLIKGSWYFISVHPSPMGVGCQPC